MSVLERVRHRARLAPAPARVVLDHEDVVVHRGERSGADMIVAASRPKDDWTEGTILLTQAGVFRVGRPEIVTDETRTRVVYPLFVKRDMDIVRRSVRYDLPQ